MSSKRQAADKPDPTIGKDGKSYPLTQKQEAFCRAVIELGDQSAAYRHAYDAENMSDEAIWVEASRIADKPKVALRLSELQEQAAAKHGVTVEGLVEKLESALRLAERTESPAAAVSAVMGQAKLLGLIVDKQESKTEISDLRKDKPAVAQGIADVAAQFGGKADDAGGSKH